MKITTEEISDFIKQNALEVIKNQLGKMTVEDISKFVTYDFSKSGFLDHNKTSALFNIKMEFNLINANEAYNMLLNKKMNEIKVRHPNE